MLEELYHVQLPSEVIASIILHLPRDGTYTKTLWACCLLSRTWYQGAIAALYAAPRLTNKNFDKFARTICPPVNAHIKQIGLETLVHRLDMGALAYESSNSLTARLLRRTRANLETFVAPAVSFSISCLAPLSKCQHLRVLDASRDYHLGLSELLDAIKDLPIEVLSLPRSAMKQHCKLYPSSPDGAKWPIRLRKLEITDVLPRAWGYWHMLFASLPPTLSSLALEETMNWNSIKLLRHGSFMTSNIKCLSFSTRSDAELFPVDDITRMFPGVTMLTIPAPRQEAEFAWWAPDEVVINPISQLEVLRLRKLPGVFRVDPFITTAMLYVWAQSNQNLFKIILPDEYLRSDDDSEHDLEKVEKLMASRVNASEESGIFLT